MLNLTERTNLKVLVRNQLGPKTQHLVRELYKRGLDLQMVKKLQILNPVSLTNPNVLLLEKTTQAQRSVTAEGSLENRLKSSKRHAKTNFESDMAGCSAVKTTSKSRKATNVNEYQQNLLTSLSDKALGKLESNISDQTEFPAIRTAQTKKSSSGFRKTLKISYSLLVNYQ
ncbi:hypothetical protein JTE90_019441 [Oedothorax gibbosus]|uniref:Uncharacterized protein n=1 Tax=Oedothorax gibbosus TaxID=931172 RepID=A0AAV6TI96_9ARAC|nr:hypothetical protein JTE90_019441 [Oedothorax gibbosus]